MKNMDHWLLHVLFFYVITKDLYLLKLGDKQASEPVCTLPHAISISRDPDVDKAKHKTEKIR